jgi:hypothetical protein
MEILDKVEEQNTKPKFLKRSALLFKLCVGLFLFSISITAFIKPLFKEDIYVFDLLIALPILSIFFLSPVGLFYSWKSMKKKEGFSSSRFNFFIGHMIFCLLILGFILALVSDIRQLM